MKISKVKGHATEEMVSEGKVKVEDKKGNDKADEAADQGATKSQGKVQKFAELYAWIQGMYRNIMTKIQNFIVEVKKEERRLKQGDEKEKDPFEKKEEKKIGVPKNLSYAEEGEAEKIKMNRVKREWCEDKEECEYTNGVRQVFERIRWKKYPSDEGGVTWLALFAIYTAHGGRKGEGRSRERPAWKTEDDAKKNGGVQKGGEEDKEVCRGRKG